VCYYSCLQQVSELVKYEIKKTTSKLVAPKQIKQKNLVCIFLAGLTIKN